VINDWLMDNPKKEAASKFTFETAYFKNQEDKLQVNLNRL
jgi:hypothetical protein